MTKVVLLLVACAALVAAASAIGAATPTIRGAVGPGDTIRLTVKPKKAGKKSSVKRSPKKAGARKAKH